jgi:hypothetical protein
MASPVRPDQSADLRGELRSRIGEGTDAATHPFGDDARRAENSSQVGRSFTERAQ